MMRAGDGVTEISNPFNDNSLMIDLVVTPCMKNFRRAACRIPAASHFDGTSCASRGAAPEIFFRDI
jgi:hypothetical protein